MIAVGQDYNRNEWEQLTTEIHGIQRDVLHDKFAYDLPHADFYIYEDKKEGWVYGVKMISGKNIFEGKRIKVLGRISKIEYRNI
jgi:hypothetical protein